MASQADPLAPLRGLPHLFTNSATIIPVIMGLRELNADSAVVLLSRGLDADALLQKLDALRVNVLNSEWIARCVLDPQSIVASEKAVRSVLPLLRETCPRGLVWNYTTGTKQMMLGLYSGLDVGDRDSLVKDLLYVDTRTKKPIYLESVGEPLTTSVSLDLNDLLHTGGYKCHSGWQLKRPSKDWQPPPTSVSGMTCWLQSLQPHAARFTGSRPPALQDTDSIPLQVAFGLLESGFVSELLVNTKVVSLGTEKNDPGAQEFDVLFAHRNTLVGVECKQTRQGGAGPQLIKIHDITKRIGGQYAVPVLIRQKLSRRPGKTVALPVDPDAMEKAQQLGVIHLAWHWPNWQPIIKELAAGVENHIRTPG